ncbi:hypothetical protein HB778_17695 [Mesorhizobium huakuii]|uniref:Uncharacterized protein n=1 Tax=Mesorhizobium huakuii TaxID=28104 RepID=A0A7G6T3H2_9HYPH|nr:hypothetical protein HB778_17695 [Mesorhizobium huakuii]
MVSILFGVAFLRPAAAGESEDSVKNAFLLCAMIDNTGIASAPCEVSGWSSSVTAVFDMSSGQARDLCDQVAQMMRDKGARFGQGWTLQIKSPYSGDNTIAFCHL